MKRFEVGLIVVGIVLCSSLAFALSVKEVQEAIGAKGENWVAAENWTTRLSLEEKKGLTGALPEPADVIARKLALMKKKTQTSSPKLSAPASWDWRNKDGKDWLTPIRSQGMYGTCAAFASIACLESVIEIHAGNSTLNPNLSERFLFAYGGGLSTTGWWASQAGDFLRSVGTVSEAAYPYSGYGGANPTDSASQYIGNTTYLIEDWNIVVSSYGIGSEAAIKNALMNYPLIAWIDIYDDFYSYSSDVYNHTTGDLIGGHYVLLIGWDDAGDYWICKNSWDTTWGESGFFRIKKSTQGNCNFANEVYGFSPRTSHSFLYYESTNVPVNIPDSGSVSSQCEVGGLANCTDITLKFYINHTRDQDIACTLYSPIGASATVLNHKGGSHQNFEDLFLNDNNAWVLSTFISQRNSYCGGYYRGCAIPESSIESLLSGLPYVNWTLNVADDSAGETGNLAAWGVFFAADHVTGAKPESWSRY